MFIKNKGKIILDLQGTPSSKDSICLSHGHGYHAYVNTHDSFIHTFFKDVCIWGGSTNIYYERGTGTAYHMYELNCQHKDFFMSDMFEHICQRHDMELVICIDDSSIMRNFFDSVCI